MNSTKVFSRVLIPLIFIVLAYEWIISGIDKLLSGTFISRLHDQFVQAIPDIKYPFYARILNQLLPYSTYLAWMILIASFFVGLSFVLLAFVISNNQLSAPMLSLGIAAGILSAFMSLNFFFFQSGTYFIHAADPFDEGISLDFIMFLLQISIAAACSIQLKAGRRSFYTYRL